jgi:hypothetical protein
LYFGVAAANSNDVIVTGLFENYFTIDRYNFGTSIGPGVAGAGVQCAKVFPGKGVLGAVQYGIAGHIPQVTSISPRSR